MRTLDKNGSGWKSPWRKTLAALLASLLTLLSLGSASPEFHQAFHGDHDQDHSSQHTCVIVLLKDGMVEIPSGLDPVVERTDKIVLIAVNLADCVPFYVRPRLLPWSSGPPLIG